jgi:hypothetical protein
LRDFIGNREGFFVVGDVLVVLVVLVILDISLGIVLSIVLSIVFGFALSIVFHLSLLIKRLPQTLRSKLILAVHSLAYRGSIQHPSSWPPAPP